ncbi:MAG: endopeptidase La [Clostridium sp.]|nr:endopeptidase La [Prevotella sp.]MCM1428837.1 endopeptidase La [Clostridium sp.]MCM1475212.1 endopeptidase La [Muribaculaceae bacterium]
MKKKNETIIDNNLFSSNPTGTIVTGFEEIELGTEMPVTTPDSMPILPLRGIVAFEDTTMPIPIGRESSKNLCEHAEKENLSIVLLTQKDSDVETPVASDMYRIGVIARVLKFLTLPDGTATAFIHTGKRVKVKYIKRLSGDLVCQITPYVTHYPAEGNLESAALTSSVNERFNDFLNCIDDDHTREMRFALNQTDNPIRLMNFICMNAPFDYKVKQMILEENEFEKRLKMLLFHLDQALQLMEIKMAINERTHADISQQQKEHFLQQQMNVIQNELGQNDEEDIRELEERAKKKNWNEKAAEHFSKELKKLGRLNLNNPEYAVQYGYLDTLLNLPWDNYSSEPVDISKVERVLDEDHYGLEKVKERIIEHIAVLKLRQDMKSPILCLVGPPGVGKTSLGRSVARALGREYARISLGGVHDEAEIRGHRRTYIGSMPGRILAALGKCGTGNPVIVLDEVDKIGKDHKGDPSTALLEVLDPEQNMKFHDNYVDVDYDLSKIFFIATSNSLSTISGPLLDRMEIIDISGYIAEEKIEIAIQHLVPKELDANGFEKGEVKFNRDALRSIIENYTRESGVRTLEKKIAKILRKLAVKKASGKEVPSTVTVELAKQFLGREEVVPDVYENNDYLGVVTGLAWTSLGGEILFIESSLSKGKGTLTLTGNLGDVMKESATLALQYLKAHAEDYGIDPERFATTDIHIHVPEGAIPKDGPSAGVTMVTSLASSLTGRKVRSKLAMTGEITLRGKVLPVGGIKEKILAARRAGITDIILSKENRKDIEEINDKYLTGLTFHYVGRLSEVTDFALI